MYFFALSQPLDATQLVIGKASELKCGWGRTCRLDHPLGILTLDSYLPS